MALYDSLLALSRKFVTQIEQEGRFGKDNDQQFVNLWKALMAEGLSLVPKGNYGTALFNQLNRLRPTVCVETVCIEERGQLGGPHVWLRRRRSNESYAGQYEGGGMGWDGLPQTFDDMVRDTVRTDFGLSGFCYKLLPLAAYLHQEERGPYMHIPCAVILGSDRDEPLPPNAIRVPENALPKNTVEHIRLNAIPPALNYWWNRDACDELERAELKLLGVNGLGLVKEGP